jgi:hypothetical protein
MDAVNKRRNPCPCRESNPGRPVCGLVSVATELSKYLRRHISIICTCKSEVSLVINNTHKSVHCIWKLCLIVRYQYTSMSVTRWKNISRVFVLICRWW